MRGKSPLSGEDRLIARFFAPIATHPGALELSDDAAFLTPPPGHDTVLKTDAIIGGVHFFPDDPAEMVARKALRVNLSDLAAKGAQPVGFLVSLALPKEIDAVWLKGFSRGLQKDAALFGCPLLGGDTDRTPGPITVAVFVVGTLPRGTMVKRAGARAGDVIFATGTIGDAALGLTLRRDAKAAKRWKLPAKAEKHLRDRYLVPQPRNALAEALRAHASAAMDVSDGLAGDLAKLCRVSGVSATIDVEQVPLSAGARAAVAAERTALETILSGGDDYEIVCTVPPDRVDSFRQAAISAGVAVAPVGTIVAGKGGPVFHARGRKLAFKKPAFSHF